MSQPHDDKAAMGPPLDDAIVEDLIAGRAIAGDGDLAEISAILEEFRTWVHGPAPRPSPALARLLGTGARPDSGRPPTVAGLDLIRSSRRSAGLVGKAALLLLITAASVIIAGAVRVLPGSAQHVVAEIVEALTPFRFPEDADDVGGVGRRSDDGNSGGALGGEEGTNRGPLRPGESRDEPVDMPPTTGPPGAGGTARPQAPPGRPYSPPLGGGLGQPPGAPGSSERDSGTAPGRHAGRQHTATLTGAAQVPGPGDLDGGGTAWISLNPGRDLLCLALNVAGIEPATGVHVHEGPAAAVGPIVASLAPADDGSTICVALDGDVLKKIRKNPGAYYVEVHNAEFPAGALRGQLS